MDRINTMNSQQIETKLNLHEWFGGIDIYLFDQLLKGRFLSGTRLLDIGCGPGRNLVYFLRQDFQVYGVDQSEQAISNVRQLAESLNPNLPLDNFQKAPAEQLPFTDESFDAVIANAVFHFARDENQFVEMVRESWRVLKPGGLFFARLASSIGIEDRIEHLEGRRFHLPDGSDRFLVDEAYLIAQTHALGGDLMDPIKTVNVQGIRCMTNWCLRKKDL